MKALADIPVDLIAQAQQAALVRLQLYLVGRTHEMLRGVLADCRRALEGVGMGTGRTDGQWDGLTGYLAIEGVTKAWGKRFGDWQRLFEGLRWAAAALPLGTLAVLHGYAFGAIEGQESKRAGEQGSREAELWEAAEIPVTFEPQLRAVLDAARERVYGDGFKLSQRIWRLDQESLERIRQVVYQGVADGSSAWQVAGQLEGVLGAGADCPRWTRSRLYRLTKSDIASGDRTGLYSGDECDAQGVSYNALRLARNEIQIAHHRATDEIMGRIPWIEKEQVMLSPAHPETDICDDVVGAGERGEGIYPKGEILLPLHVQCLCYKVAVLLPPDEFAGKLRGWVRGESEWPEMDEYGAWLGVGRSGMASASLGQTLGGELLTWLWGDQAAMDAAAERFLLPDEQLVFPD